MSQPNSSGKLSSLGPVVILTGIGIISTAAFQLLVIRRLGPESYGMLAAYLALINVASIGSSAVRSSVAVGAARADLQVARGKRDRTLWESAAYGLAFSAAVIVMLFTGAYNSWIAGALVAVSVIPYFVFARAQGLMQGNHRVARVLIWSTGAQLGQLIGALAAMLLGLGWLGVLAATMLTALLGAMFSTRDVQKLSLISTAKPFTPIAVRALTITIAFTWLISMDVTWVQQFGSATSAGEYGAIVSLVKVGFLVPTTLALYLLPRFARNIDDSKFQARALGWSAAAATVSGGAFALVLWLWPGAVTIFFGAAYANAGSIAFLIALAYLPWVVAQSITTQFTAQGSPLAAIVLIVAAAVQYLVARAVLPDLNGWILAHGLIGLAIVIVYTVMFRLQYRNRNEQKA